MTDKEEMDQVDDNNGNTSTTPTKKKRRSHSSNGNTSTTPIRKKSNSENKGVYLLYLSNIYCVSCLSFICCILQRR